MKDALSLALGMALGILLPLSIVRHDVRRLDDVKLARAWPDVSAWSAVVAFGPLSLLVHFIRTRRNLWGAALGLFWLGVWALVAVVQMKLEQALGGVNW